MQTEKPNWNGSAKLANKTAPQPFVEFPFPYTRESECLIDMENRHGDRMLIRLSGERTLDLLSLARPSGAESHDPDHSPDADTGGGQGRGLQSGIDGSVASVAGFSRKTRFGDRCLSSATGEARPSNILMYDGQGFWLCQKRLSTGCFQWWPQNLTAG